MIVPIDGKRYGTAGYSQSYSSATDGITKLGRTCRTLFFNGIGRCYRTVGIRRRYRQLISPGGQPAFPTDDPAVLVNGNTGGSGIDTELSDVAIPFDDGLNGLTDYLHNKIFCSTTCNFTTRGCLGI